VVRADLRVERTVYAWGCKDNGRLGGVGDKKTFEPQEVGHGCWSLGSF
jgi:alpha-tubulin suppressor-like RCC1 family protein